MSGRFAVWGLGMAVLVAGLAGPLPARAQIVASMLTPVTAAFDDADHARAVQCMTLAIAYEAGYESEMGRQAVGEVILNRTGNPAYPHSVCGVVFQGSARRTGCQFTFTCDGALRRALPAAVMQAARTTAEQVLSGQFVAQVAGATHYHASYVSPYWAPTLVRIGRIGAHIFYRTPAAPAVPAAYVPVAEPATGGLAAVAVATDPYTQRRAPAGGGAGVAAAPAAPPVFSPWGLASALPRTR